MTVIEIEDRDAPVERVSTDEVVREWAIQEIAEERDEDVDVESRSPEELIGSFEERQRLAESIFLEEDLEWYRLSVSEAELRNLLVVKGPEDEGWRTVAEGNEIGSIAERIADAEDLEGLDQAVAKDVDDVHEMAESFGSGEGTRAFIAVQESTDEPAYLADGNHRAVALVYHLLTGGEYDPQTTYVGVPPSERAATLGEEREGVDDHPAS
jgi:hypothetical protein